MASDDTIFALSSGRVPSGVAVVRLSGTDVRFGFETLLGHVPEARKAKLGAIRGADGRPIDSGIAIYFPGPRSFTGEDCGEFHIHGGAAGVSALLKELGRLPGFRHAEPGEFTRRAFLNGKVDLTGAEALADLIAAETESQRRLALDNAQGAQRRLYEDWRDELIRARAMVEAELDFSDEGDIPGSVADSVWKGLDALRQEIVRHAAGFSRAEMIRDGVRIVIVGAPNAGKSSLLNALARRDVAIVSDEPGTTRDLVEVSLDLEGVKVILTDTAGLRESGGKVEAEGISRARNRARNAHLILFLEDTSDPVAAPFAAKDVPVITVGAKSDLPRAGGARAYDVLLSVRSGEGLEHLMRRLSGFAREAAGRAGETLPSRLRHVHYLTECESELAAALVGKDLGLEIRAEYLRKAADALGRIVGRVDVEDLLGIIFSEFCIGK